ncbi:MAG TPA: hypothetical protein VG944_06030, partial [Fimbriimonas sp.]|nr:hypothetical protein [Fimbriimonas sp.]
MPRLCGLCGPSRTLVGLLSCFFIWFAAAPAGAQALLTPLWRDEALTPAFSIAYSPDGKLLAVGGDSGVQVFNAQTGAFFRFFAYNVKVQALAFEPNGQQLVIGGTRDVVDSPGCLQIWNVQSGKVIADLATQVQVRTLCVTSDGMQLAAAGTTASSGLVEIWDLSTLTLDKNLSTKAYFVGPVQYSPDNAVLALSGLNQTETANVVELWNVAAGTDHSLKPNEAAVDSFGFSPDGKTLALGGGTQFSGSIELWDLDTLTLKVSLPSTTQGVTGVAFSPDGSVLAGVGRFFGVSEPNSYRVELWNTSDDSAKATVNLAEDSQASSLAFSPDGSTLAVNGTEESETSGMIDLIDVASGALRSSLNVGMPEYKSASFAPNGLTLALGGFRATQPSSPLLELWDTTGGRVLKTLPVGADVVNQVAYSPDGRTLVAAGFHGSSSELELWDMTRPTPIYKKLAAAGWSVLSASFSPDGKYLADVVRNEPSYYNGQSLLEVWNLATGKIVKRMSANCALCVCYSPDGKFLAIGGRNPALRIDGTLELLDSTGFRQIWGDSMPLAVLALAYSPDGRALAGAGGDSQGNLGIFDAHTGVRIASPQASSYRPLLSSVAYSPDGSALFAGGDEGLLAFSARTYGRLGNDFNAVRSPAALA